ncbi:hypothetical protein CHS0354_006740 [Potamilus streckersoni]|uniref:Protein FAM60A n=1 Tax=Potamilus streckersoni TaxID=2493646 RepID=A0AAE0VHH1_9BIVA|nr:hypothetical protein CHS0354_006740 [Potamilus streckersoni]
MFSFHKPKIYRSINGCCICRAKSSSSRFTDSKKYEPEFEKCFRIKEKRTGEICNACVLLVKRWKKLPNETNRHWHHVVDARAGPGIKSTLKIKNKLSPSKQKYKSPLKSKRSFTLIPNSSLASESLSGYDENSLDKNDLFTRNMSDSEDSDDNGTVVSRNSKKKVPDQQISSFLDLTYWKKTKICCGIIFKGLNGEVMVDPHLLKPCISCHKKKSPVKEKLHRSQSLEDTDSNSSGSSPSFGEIDFYNVSSQSTPDIPPPDNDVEVPMILDT